MAELRKVLGFPTLVLITINSIIGTGVFFLPSIGAAKSGPGSLVAWAILSIIVLYIAMCFAELVSMFPTSGGMYEFCKRAFGPFPSFLMGWLGWLEVNITTAMLLVGGVQYGETYIKDFLIYLMGSDAATHFAVTLTKILICVFLILFFNFLTFKGVETSAVMLVFFSVITLSVVLITIAGMAIDLPTLMSGGGVQSQLDFSKLEPFFIGEGGFGSFILILVTVFLISEAFFGFESVCYLAGETKRPEKTIPKALIVSIFCVAILTITLVTFALATIDWKTFGDLASPFAEIGKITMGAFGETLITVGTMVLVVGAAAAWVVSGPRLIVALAEDKMFPTSFAAIHTRNGTPYKAIIFQSIVMIAIVTAAFFGGEQAYLLLLKLLIPLVLVMLSIVVAVVPILRITMRDVERPFRVPFGFLGPCLIIGTNVFLFILWMLEEGSAALNIVQLGLSFVIVGLPIYLLLTVYYNPTAITRLNDLFAGFSAIFERLFYPKKIQSFLLDHLGKIKGKHVLEYGCSVGTFTVRLAEEVGKDGKVFATEISKRAARIAEKRLAKEGHLHVKVLHDSHQINRIHTTIPKVHAVVSMGMLGYIQNSKKVLKEISSRMPDNGKIVFIDYCDFFNFIPNTGLLSDDDKIRKEFNEAGFSVEITRLDGAMWNYIVVYGIKSDEQVPVIE